MKTLEIGGAPIAYEDQGEGDAVVLVHGFAASVKENWERSGWISMLVRARRRVVALDLRGHGQSAKFYEPEAYSFDVFASDVVTLVEHLQLKKPDLIGFSLGARVVLQCLLSRPEKFLLGVLCGVGELLLDPKSDRDPEGFAKAMEASSADAISDDMARRFRLFAEGQGQDLRALAAVSRGLNAHPRLWTAADLSAIKHETLVVAGAGDDLAGAPEPLAKAFPNAKGLRVPGCGHMDCLIQPMFKGAVMDFLAGMPA
ncbi:MAG: alpha/beta fold hydrolase [Alphaproteobacteria bacterium]|nr:alpha/beta fold hydrolase [Alphaproteobacteria bacterium]